MNPKLPLDGRIYILTVGRVLNTIVFQINLGRLLFRATLKVRLGSSLSTNFMDSERLKTPKTDCVLKDGNKLTMGTLGRAVSQPESLLGSVKNQIF